MRAPRVVAAGAPSFTHPRQHPVDRRRAHREQFGADVGAELEMAMPLHRLDQHRHQRFQPLAANSVRRLPKQNERVPFRLIIDPTTPPPTRLRSSLAPQKPHRVLAVISGYVDELV